MFPGVMGSLEVLLFLAAGVALIAPAALLFAAARAGRDAWGLRAVERGGGSGPYRAAGLHGWERERVPALVWLAAIAAAVVAVATVGLLSLTAIEAWMATMTVKGAEGATAIDGMRWAALIVWGGPFAIVAVLAAGRALRSPDGAIAAATRLGWACALFGGLALGLVVLDRLDGKVSPWALPLAVLATAVGVVGLLGWAAELSAWRRKLRASPAADQPARE